MKLFIFGEDQQAGLAYAKRNGLRPGSFEAPSRPDQMKAFPQPVRVLLVGRVERRHDYEDLLEVIKELNPQVDRIAITGS